MFNSTQLQLLNTPCDEMVFHAHMKPHITSSTATKTTAPTASLHRIQKFNDTSAVFIWIMLQIFWSYSLQMFPESIRVGLMSVFRKTLRCKHTLIECVCNCACSKSDCVMGRLNSSSWELLLRATLPKEILNEGLVCHSKPKTEQIKHLKSSLLETVCF